jgi:hypothetical protein
MINQQIPLNNIKRLQGKQQVNIFALGDVGSTLLSGLFLLGGDMINTIGIWDIEPAKSVRLETEYGQIASLNPYHSFPKVKAIERESFFSGDIVIFCASAGVPPLDYRDADVRMMQWERNLPIVTQWAKEGATANFKGLMAIVSDPVDLLCKAALLAAQEINPAWTPDSIRGYGLGVMHGRGCYYSRREAKFASYENFGRAFGPHGKGLVIANSIEEYDEGLSLELGQKVLNANLEARKNGYKPFIAPALASGAISILSTVSGHWNYSAVYMGDGREGAYFGLKNRLNEKGTEIENLDLPDKLYDRIFESYKELCMLY